MVHKVDSLKEQVNTRLDEMQGTLSKLMDDVKKGEKSYVDKPAESVEEEEVRGVRSPKDKGLNNNDNNKSKDNVEANISGGEGGDDDEGNDGPESSKVKSQIEWESAAQTEGESEFGVLFVTPLATLIRRDQVDIAYQGVVENIRKRVRESEVEEETKQ